MTSPSAATPLSRILLVGDRDRPAQDQHGPAVRRYRLARLHMSDRASGPGRHEHLRRSYD